MMSRPTERTIRDAFARWDSGDLDKFHFYGIVNDLHARRRCTYSDVTLATGIAASVVADRVRYLRHLATH